MRLKEGVSLREDVSLAGHVQTGHEKKSCTLYRSSRCPSGGSLPVSVRKFCGDQCQWGRWGRKIDMPNERHDPAANEGPDEDANAETVPLKDYQHLQEQHERIEDAADHLLGQCESFVRLFAASSFYYKDRDRELMTKFRAYEAFSACEKARNAGIGLG